MQKSFPGLVNTNSLGLLGAFVSDWLISFSGGESEVANDPHGSLHGNVFSLHTPSTVGRVECSFVACMHNLTSAFLNFEFDNGVMIANLAPHPLTMGDSCRM